MPILSKLRTIATICLLASPIATPAATLVKRDFLTPGDGFITFDPATNLEWLAPSQTSNHAFDDAFVQAIRTNYGFRYATALEVEAMFDTNFGTLPGLPGTAAGIPAADEFFFFFGYLAGGSCGISGDPFSDCRKLIGMTSTPGSSSANRLQFYVIRSQYRATLIRNLDWPAVEFSETGSFLVRQAAEIPEPASAALLGVGAALVGLSAMKKRDHRVEIS